MTDSDATGDRLQGGWRMVLAGAQMLFVAFGALVLMPLLTGLDPNVALFTAGIGTLLFHLVTGLSVPIFLASSFVFIAPISYASQTWGVPATMGALMAAGVVYMLLALVVRLRGAGIIHRIMPPVVTGPVIMIIGLGLAPLAVNMAMGKTGDGSAELFPYTHALLVSMAALVTTLLVSVFAHGIFRLLPILSGVLVGYLVAWFSGMVDLTQVQNTPLVAMPAFVAPEFNWAAIMFMIPVAIAPAIEHVGDIIAIGNVTHRDYIRKPGLHRTLLGDGIATSAAALFGRTAQHHLFGGDRSRDADAGVQSGGDALGGRFCHPAGLCRQVRCPAAEHPVAGDGGHSDPAVWLHRRGGAQHPGQGTGGSVPAAQSGDRCHGAGVRHRRHGDRQRGAESAGVSLCGLVAILLNQLLPGAEPLPADLHEEEQVVQDIIEHSR